MGPVRQRVREMVAGIDPLDGVEVDHRADVLAWLDSDAEVFRLAKPATPPKHLVSYCVLVDSDDEHALLVDHRDARRWLPAGGHIEPGEHPALAAKREMAEELCIEPSFHRTVGETPLFITVTKSGGLSESHTDVSLWFVFETAMDEAITPDEREFAGVRWWPLDEIGPGEGVRFDPHLPRFVTKFRQQVTRFG